MNRLLKLKNTAAVLAYSALAFTGIGLAGCSRADVEGSLPAGGKHPVVFAATVEGHAAAGPGTRATTDNSWANGDKVAVKIGTIVKEYTAAAGGVLTAAAGVTSWYWQAATESVEAWYPYSVTKPERFTVMGNQTDIADYQRSDMVYEKKTISFPSQADLAFKHLPAKVVVHLKHGDGITEDQVGGATVAMMNQSLVSDTVRTLDWSVVQARGTDVIFPYVEATAGGFQKSVRALVVPQQMQGKPFIKVTIGTNVYYYTPAGVDDANFAAGKKYTYEITVNATGLVAKTTAATTWASAGSDIVTAGTRVESFNVDIPTVSGITIEDPDQLRLVSSTTYQTADNVTSCSFVYTIPADGAFKGFRIKRGVADIERTLTQPGQYTFTLNNIHSNIELAYDHYGSVGDYYNSDGSFSDVFDVNQAIGIVFKVGPGTEDHVGNYGDKLSYGTIGGYVMALKDTPISAWHAAGYSTLKKSNEVDFDGYTNTENMKKDAIGGALSPTNYAAAHLCVNHQPGAPPASSGWYMPSTGQFGEIYKLRTTLNAKLGANGEDTRGFGICYPGANKQHYWPSTRSHNEVMIRYVTIWPNKTYPNYPIEVSAHGAYSAMNRHNEVRSRAVLTY